MRTKTVSRRRNAADCRDDSPAPHLYDKGDIEEIPGERKALNGQNARKAADMRLALYQPDIPQNCGTILRLGACLGIPVDIIEPCGFHLDDKRLRRAGLDYLSAGDWQRHGSWEDFRAVLPGRLLLLTTRGETRYSDFSYASDDTLLLGRESAGAPEEVHRAADARLAIPLKRGLRSINVATAAAMVLGEALRQTDLFPRGTPE